MKVVAAICALARRRGQTGGPIEPAARGWPTCSSMVDRQAELPYLHACNERYADLLRINRLIAGAAKLLFSKLNPAAPKKVEDHKDSWMNIVKPIINSIKVKAIQTATTDTQMEADFMRPFQRKNSTKDRETKLDQGPHDQVSTSASVGAHSYFSRAM